MLGLSGLWCLKTASSQKLADKGMRVLLLGYGAALGSKAQLLAGHRIDFFTKGLYRLLCLGRGLGAQGLAARGLSSEPCFQRETP